MKKLEGLTIDEVTDLGNNDLCLTLDDGTTLVGHIFVVEGSAPAAAAKPEAKEAKEEKPAAKEEKKGPKVPTWDELQDMEMDELKDLIDDHDLAIKTKGKDEDDLKEEIAEELEIEEPKKPTKEEKKPVKDDDLTWKDLVKMDYDELGDLIKEETLNVKIKNFDEDDDDEMQELREAVAKAMDIPVKK